MGNTGGVIDGIAEDIILSKQSRSEGNTDPDGETRQLRLIKTALLDGAGSLTGLGAIIKARHDLIANGFYNRSFMDNRHGAQSLAIFIDDRFDCFKPC